MSSFRPFDRSPNSSKAQSSVPDAVAAPEA
jgi:hypothetical protein